MAQSAHPLAVFATERRDAWWREIVFVVIVLGGFGVYATLRAFEGAYYEWGPYLSPFYSPLIDPEGHWRPVRLSPALFILVFPLGFRMTCYYYRKAYYRAFFLDPPGCAVNDRGHKSYRGETSFPFILQNVHRYFLYAALLFLGFLWYDVYLATRFEGGFGIGVGTLVMLANVILLTLYTLSCHSLRHLIGGRQDCFSCANFGGAQYSGWRGITVLNEKHMLWAWLSLFSVGLTDFYIRSVARGLIMDIRLL